MILSSLVVPFPHFFREGVGGSTNDTHFFLFCEDRETHTGISNNWLQSGQPIDRFDPPIQTSK